MNKPQRPFIVKLAILTVLTSLAWTGFDVYRRLTQKPAPDVPAEILSPITPELNQETLSQLEKTIYLEGESLGSTVILSPETSAPQPTPAPETTEETPPETEPTPEAETTPNE